MIGFNNIKVISSCGCVRQLSSKLKVMPEETMLNDIKSEKYKPRYHPGIIKPKSVALPAEFIEAVRNTIEDHPIKALLKDSQPFVSHLLRRMPPIEEEEIRDSRQSIYDKVLSKMDNVDISSEQQEQQFKQKVKDKVNTIMKKRIYNWAPIDYDVYRSLLYLIGRSAPNYAVLMKIFSEINMRDANFKPRSLFDFGSGVGTVTWAANQYWKKYLFEYFNVDSSTDMNDLAQTLLKGGRSTREMSLKGVFHRQFLPANNTTYDLVVSAYSFLELPSFSSRIDTILKLWNKTKHYLVVVENGSNAGFKVVNEVRDFILQIENESSKGHIFSPCPHDLNCPRFLEVDSTPCNFQMGYHPLPLGLSSEELRKEFYSYVVFKKGARNPDDPQWPRAVRESLVRSKHSICRFCTSNGKLEEVIFTASKHGKTLYHCGRSTKWGDMLPVKIDSLIKDVKK